MWINAEKLKEELSKAPVWTTLAIVEMIDQTAKEMPKRGEWQEKEIFGEYNDDVHHYVSEWQSARCSVCGKYHTTPYMYYFDEYNFCPNCGARMKGADDGKDVQSADE